MLILLKPLKGKDLADYLGITPNSVSLLKKATLLPEISGERWVQLCAGINELSQINERITPFDMVEYLENDSSNAGANTSSKNSSTEVKAPEKSSQKRKSNAA